jgi:four helix bundle protein
MVQVQSSEFEAKIGDGLKEIDETGYWLELIREGGLMAAAKMEDLEDETEQLIGIFVSILKTSKSGGSER